MTRVMAAGMAILLIVALLPVSALVQETPHADEAEYVEGEVDEEIVGGLRLTRGKHGRKMWRMTRWANSLTGDKAKVFETYGMPSSRYREETLGRVQEMWTYQEQGIEITFEGDKIVRTRDFNPATR